MLHYFVFSDNIRGTNRSFSRMRWGAEKSGNRNRGAAVGFKRDCTWPHLEKKGCFSTVTNTYLWRRIYAADYTALMEEIFYTVTQLQNICVYLQINLCMKMFQRKCWVSQDKTYALEVPTLCSFGDECVKQEMRSKGLHLLQITFSSMWH